MATRTVTCPRCKKPVKAAYHESRAVCPACDAEFAVPVLAADPATFRPVEDAKSEGPGWITPPRSSEGTMLVVFGMGMLLLGWLIHWAVPVVGAIFIAGGNLSVKIRQ